MKPLRADVLVEACHHGLVKGPPAKLFGGGEVGADAEGVGEGPPRKSCFGRGDVGEVTEDGGEAPHAKALEKTMPM